MLGDVSQLTSDQNDDEGLVLMVEALEHAPALKVFDSEDLARLSEHLSILEFQEGETVMQKGELATWVGIVLSGKLGAVIDGRTVGHRGVGSVVGEVAFFVGGLRQADVQGAEKGFIGVMMTAHLPEMFRDAPRTASKFVRAIGHSSVGAIAHNPAKHPVEQWSLKAADVATEVAAWRQGYWPPTSSTTSPPTRSSIRCRA